GDRRPVQGPKEDTMTPINVIKPTAVGIDRDADDQPYTVQATAGTVAVAPHPASPGVWNCIHEGAFDSNPLDEPTAPYERAVIAPTPAAAAVDYLTTRAALIATA